MAAAVMQGANPFAMPTDEQVFVLRDEEKKKRVTERERLKTRKVHEKTTWSTRIGSANTKTKVITGEDEPVPMQVEMETRTDVLEPDYLVARKKQTGFMPDITEVSKEKENMAEFIAKKREMGLTRMSLSTKRHEIRKLDEEAERAEKKIKQQEDQLEETIHKFEAFLKDNDMQAVEAMKKAESETKGKNEKTAEIKKLSAQIATISMEKMKFEEQMQACLKFKNFLDELTPVAWFRETLCNIEVQRERETLEKALDESRDSLGDDSNQVAAEQAAIQAAALEQKLEERREDIQGKLEDLPDDAIVKELRVMDPDIVPMFFTDPDKILSIFVEIEENNLFLIQNCQETEEALEELKSKFNEAKLKMDEEAANLKSQIEQIKQKISVEESKKKTLMQRMATSKDPKSQEELLRNINSKVSEIYKASGFGDNDANIAPLGMLTKIETKLEELRMHIVRLPHEFVSIAMKHRDKERRQKARAKLLDEQRVSRDERSHRALLRSQAPVLKKAGKPVMWRSRPIDKKKTEIVSEADENEDDSEFFT